MRISLVIPTYNRPEALAVVLSSVAKQDRLPDEVIITDDGSTHETKAMIDRIAPTFPVDIKYTWQEDEGFRAARARNRGIAMSTGDYIIIIDDDIVLHRAFIKSHLVHVRPGWFLHGSRVLLSKDVTTAAIERGTVYYSLFMTGIKNRLNGIHHIPLSRLFSRPMQRWDNVRSCNMSFWKSDVVAVNGFDETFTGWGKEDSELAARLLNAGVRRKNIKACAVTYHLYHPVRENDHILEKNKQLLYQSVKHNRTVAPIGISSHVDVNRD